MATTKKSKNPQPDFDFDTATSEELDKDRQLESDILNQIEDEASSPNVPFEQKNYHELRESDAEYERQRKERQASAHSAGIFASAVQSRQILEGRIAAVEAGSTTAYWICYDGPVMIRIPFNCAFTNPPKELCESSRKTVEPKVNFLSKSIGATIPFVITKFEETDNGYIATGSRIAALARIRARYFGNAAIHPVQVGDILDAQIITMGNYAAYVNVKGIDTRMRIVDFSHRYIPYLSKYYSVGQTIRVKVTSIDTSDDGIPTITVSRREVELLDFPANYYRVKKGAHCLGTVITIQTQTPKNAPPRLVITLFLDDIGLPAYTTSSYLNYRDHLNLGDVVDFEMNGLAASGYVHGRITRLTTRR